MRTLFLIILFSLGAKCEAQSITSSGTTLQISSELVSPSLLSFVNYNSIGGVLLAASGADLGTHVVGDRITNWTGSVGSLSCAVATNAPTYNVSTVNGKPGLWFDLTNYMTFSAPTWMNTNCTIFIAAESTNMAGLGYRYLLSGSTTHLLDGADTFGIHLYVWLNSGDGTGSQYNSILNDTAPLTTTETRPCVRFFRFNGSANTGWPESLESGWNRIIQPATYTNSVLGWPRSGVLALGSQAASLGGSTVGWRGLIQEVVIFTNSLTIAECKSVQSYLCAKYQCSVPPYALMDGDQGFIGGGMGVNEKQYAPVYWQLTKAFGASLQGGPTASTLRALSDIETAATNATGTLSTAAFPSRSDLLYLLYYGTAYFSFGTGVATDLWPKMSNCMAYAKSRGYVVPAMTLLPYASTNDSERVAYNALLRQQWPACASVLVDFDTLPFTLASDRTNTLYYLNDTTTFTPSSYFSSRLSQFILQNIRGLCTTNLIPR